MKNKMKNQNESLCEIYSEALIENQARIENDSETIGLYEQIVYSQKRSIKQLEKFIAIKEELDFLKSEAATV